MHKKAIKKKKTTLKQRKKTSKNNADLFICFVEYCWIKYKLRKSYLIYNSFCLYSKTLARL